MSRRQAAYGVMILVCLQHSASHAFWTALVSDETPPATCMMHPAVTALCSGRYCDNIELECTDAQPLAFDGNQRSWSPFATSTTPSAKCDGNSYVTGIACKGDYCGAISIECTRAFANATACTGAILSEECGGVPYTVGSYYAMIKNLSCGSSCTMHDIQAHNLCGGLHQFKKNGMYIHGIGCRGSHCDDVILDYCHGP